MSIIKTVSITTICLALCACFATNPHSKCIEQEPYQAAIPYCCKFKGGYCQQTCYNYETRYRCISSECDEGYQWVDIPDAKWWQNNQQCVPIAIP